VVNHSHYFDENFFGTLWNKKWVFKLPKALIRWFFQRRIFFWECHCHKNKAHYHKKPKRYDFWGFHRFWAISLNLDFTECSPNILAKFQCALSLDFQGCFPKCISPGSLRFPLSSSSAEPLSACIYKFDSLLQYIPLLTKVRSLFLKQSVGFDRLLASEFKGIYKHIMHSFYIYEIGWYRFKNKLQELT